MDGLHLLLDTAIFTFLAGLVWLLSLTSLDFSVSLAVSVPSPLLFLGYFFFTWTSFHRHTIYSTPCPRVIRNLRLRLRDIPQYCNALFHPPGRNAFIAFHWLKLDGIDQVADQLIKCRPSLLNEIVAWLLRSLDHDKDIERFLESIPGVYDSGLVEQPEQVFRPFHEDQVPHMILSFMHHTISSATVPDNIKQRRIRLSLQVMELDPYLLERTFFYALSLPAKPTIFQCIDFVLVAYRVASNTNANPETQLLAKCIIAVSRLTSNEYERLLRSSISTSDTTPDRQLTSKKLDSLVFLMGLLHSASPQYRDEILPETLFAACNFPTENVSPESRSRFCETALADVVPFLTSSDEHRMLIVYCSSCPGPRYCSQSS
jgi:hypothetical protein